MQSPLVLANYPATVCRFYIWGIQGRFENEWLADFLVKSWKKVLCDLLTHSPLHT